VRLRSGIGSTDKISFFDFSHLEEHTKANPHSPLFRPSPSQKSYTPTTTLTGHTDWVRDVAFAPTILQKSYIASASQDKTVRIWTSTPTAPGQAGEEWKCTVLNFDAVLWRVSWSLSGNVLAVSGGDNKVSLWKENLKGEWDCVRTIEE